VRRRFKFAVALASLTGLTASLPVALALGAHSFVSFLVREVSYATAIAIGALCFTAALTSARTRQTGSGEVGYHESDAFEHGILHRINPASGLPMSGALDLAGNVYGFCSHDHSEHRHWDTEHL
jgi:hypothetical protein